jgi:DNA-directed RNA polymerase specialized sigma24 family protein
VIPKSDPLYYDEIATEPHLLTARTLDLDEPLDLSRWRWADIADDLRVILQRAIRTCLTDKQQAAVNLALDGLSGVQIARTLGVSKVTVHWYLVRARRRLKAQMMTSRKARERLRKGLERTYHDEEES